MKAKGQTGDRVIWSVSFIWDKVQNGSRVKEVECVKSSGDEDVAALAGRRVVSGV